MKLNLKIADSTSRFPWLCLHDYWINHDDKQTFPMVRMDGEFYDFTPIKKTEYDQIMAMLNQTSEELQPLLVVKREIDGKICVAEKNVWDIVNQAKENEV